MKKWFLICIFICTTNTSFAQSTCADLFKNFGLIKYPIKDIFVPTPTSTVLSLPKEINLKNIVSLDNGNALIFSIRRLVHNDPVSRESVAEYLVEDSRIVDANSGKTLFNEIQAETLVYDYLTKSHEGQKISDLQLASLVANYNSSTVLFKADFLIGTSSHHMAVFSYDFRSTKLTLIWSTEIKQNDGRDNPLFDNVRFSLDGKLALIQFKDLKYQRIPVTSGVFYKNVSDTYYAVIDLANPKTVLLQTNSPNLKISADGKTVLLSDRTQNNALVSLSSTSTEAPLTITDSDGLLFLGNVLAHNNSLSRFIVNNEKSGFRNGSSYPYTLPSFSLVELVKGKLKKRKLGDTKELLRKIKSGVKKGVFIKYNNTQGQMISDGRYFLLNITFTTEAETIVDSRRQIRSVEQNWIGVWDLEANTLIESKTSTDLNSNNDKEHTLTKGGLLPFASVWRRQFATRILENGTVILARAIVHGAHSTEAEVVVKINVFNLDTSIDKTYEYSTGKINLNYFDNVSNFVGTSKFIISPDGTVYADITGVGIKIITPN